MNPLDINWHHIDEDVLKLLSAPYKIIPLQPGLEADVMKIETSSTPFVLKVWNKHSKPDIHKQFELLSSLYNNGMPVSKAFGWGTDQQHNQVLLTSFNGIPISILSKNKLTQLAKMITAVHTYEGDNGTSFIPTYNFVSYFFPSIESHPDIHTLLVQLLDKVELANDVLIHGDYNLGNVLEDQEKLTIIDWTNGQYGDARYDIAWSILLMKVFAGVSNGKFYQTQCIKLSTYDVEELVIFEAIACLRLLLLSRIVGGLLNSSSVSGRFSKIIESNIYLNTTKLVNVFI